MLLLDLKMQANVHRLLPSFLLSVITVSYNDKSDIQYSLIGLLLGDHAMKFLQSHCKLANCAIHWEPHVSIRQECNLYTPYLICVIAF